MWGGDVMMLRIFKGVGVGGGMGERGGVLLCV